MAELSAPIGPNEVIITEDNYRDFVDDPRVNGKKKKMGLWKPRAQKYAMRAGVSGSFDIPLIPESEWEGRLAQQIKDKQQLSDIRNRGMNGDRIPSRDQNGEPYCWGHSSTSLACICRAIQHQPYKDLSAFAVCCIIKNYKSQGGWSEESLRFIAERGIPTSKTWPQQSKSRANDNPETWAEAKENRFAPEWMALDSGKMKAQMVTCLLLGIPITTDLNWWSHAIITLDIVSFKPFRTRIWNSWSDDWSENGTGILEGSRAIPDDAQAAVVMSAA